MNLEQKTMKYIIFAQLTIEAMDDLKETVLYRQDVKRKANLFIDSIKHIEKLTDQIYHKDNEMLTNTFKQTEELINDISKCGVAELIMIKQIHDYYKTHKEEWNDLYSLELDKID